MRALGVALILVGVGMIVLRRPVTAALRGQAERGLTGAPPAAAATVVYWCISLAWIVLGALLALGILGG